MQDIANIVNQYNSYQKFENFIVHAGHNNTVSGSSGCEIANILMKSVSGIIKKLSPHRNAICNLPPVKDSFFGGGKNNENIDKYKEAFENDATELSVVFDIDVLFLIKYGNKRYQ